MEIFDGDMISKAARDDFDSIADVYQKNNQLIPDSVLPKTKMYQENAAWTQKLADQNYTVLDIGNPTGKGHSVFYSMEQSTIFSDPPTK